MIQPLHAVMLGIVEGVTEFLPISSTGHLILAARALNLHGEAVKTFAIVIQGGAIAAVLGLYRRRFASMWQGLWQPVAPGRRLLVNLCVSVLPAVLVGGLWHHEIKAALFSVWPVVTALAVGGVLMVGCDSWLRRRPAGAEKTLESMRVWEALVIGIAQILALWPGTSRAMVTILAALALRFPATAAAEYSFLLALPTLGAATLLDAITGGRELLQAAGWGSVTCGFAASAIVAVLAMRAFVRYLTRHGLALFGWYRLALAAGVWLMAQRP